MKSFKSFLREQEEEKLPAFGTHFGSHAQEKLPPFGTHFGSHSKEKPTPEPESESQPEKFHADPFISSPIHKESVEPTKGKDQINYHSEKAVDAIHSKHEIEDDHYDSINEYTYHSRGINGFLHDRYKGGGKNNYHKDVVRSIDKILSKNTIKHDTHVFSGLRESPEKLFKGKPNKPVKTHFPAYTSTSTSFSQAHYFSDDRPDTAHKNHKPLNSDFVPSKNGKTRHVIKLHVPKGTNGGSVRHISEHDNEDEVLLHRGMDVEIHHQPTIMKHPHLGHVTVWHARVVGHNPMKV